MEEHHNDFKPFYCILTIIIITFRLTIHSHAEDARVFMALSNSSENTITIEVFADVATEFLGSYDLAISFNQEHIQFQSVSFGDTCCQWDSKPTHYVEDGLLRVDGVYTKLPKGLPNGLVSILFIHFKAISNCLNLPFEIYVNDLIGEDKYIILPVEVTGYEITQNTIIRIQQKQQDNLQLVDQQTVELLIPIAGMRFSRKDLFINQLIETIGEVKTNQYQSHIIRFSRVTQHLDIEMACVRVIDIVQCLQFLSGMENVTCSNVVGDIHAGLDDVMALFQKIVLFTDK